MKRLAWRTVLPAFLVFTLFSGVVFLYLIPSLDRVVRDQKRLMISELTESAWNVLARFEAEERAGRMTGAQAREAAVAQVRNLHYGRESKDYFWIIDTTPAMVVHPYRPDLEGTDLSDFSDPEGKLLFVEMAELVERDGSGFVRYMWQWKDDSERIVPKLSFVKGFEPWGWIIGTGVYTDDVDAEISALTGNLRTASLLILGLVSLLLFVLLRASFQAERGRIRAAAALRGSEEKYRSLVESAGEAILMDMPGEGLYANASLLSLLGYDDREFSKLDVADIIRPDAAEIESGRRRWQAVADGAEAPTRYEAELVRRDGRGLKVMLSLSRIVVQGRSGFMAVAARLSKPRELDVESATGIDDLEAVGRRTRDLASMMVNHGADAVQVCRMLSSGADGVVRRAVEFIVEEMGPPPAEFDFMLMGSLGRREVTLLADQDHAIIYDDVPPEEAAAAHEYFMAMGARVSDLFAAAGYPYCEGGIMSGEAECCRSFSSWCAVFNGWISGLEPDDLLRSKIFFDFRGSLGDDGLVTRLRGHLRASLDANPRFFPLLVRSVLHYVPPLTSFGGFVLKDTDGVREGFDIKGVLAQVVDVARLRALQYGVDESGTLERLEALAQDGRIARRTADETSESFRTLLSLRMRHQARRRADRLEVDNLIDPAELTEEERNRLKAVFRQLKALQDVLQHEFGVGP